MSRILSCIGLLLAVSGGSGMSDPITLEDIITRTIHSSKELDAARALEELLRLEKRMSILAFFPRLSGGFSATDTVIYSSPDTRTYRIYTGLEQPLFTGGALIEGFRTGKEALENHRYETQGIENAVIFEAAAGYARLILLEALLGIHRMTEELLEGQLRAAEEELAMGLITEMTAAKMRLARDRQTLAGNAVESEYRALRTRMAGKLGIEPAAALEPAEVMRPAYSGCLRGVTADRFLIAARVGNPGIVARRFEAAAAERAFKHAKRFWIPRITLKGEVFAAGDRLPLSVPGFSLGIDVTVPVPFLPLTGSLTVGSPAPDGRFADLRGRASERPMNGGTVTAARVASERAGLELSTALLGLEENISSVCSEIQQAGELLQREREYLSLLDYEARIAEEELRLGEIGRLEYMEAAVERASQKGKILEAQYTQFLRELEVCALSGFSLAVDPFCLYEVYFEVGK